MAPVYSQTQSFWEINLKNILKEIAKEIIRRVCEENFAPLN